MTTLQELFKDMWADDQPANLVDLIESPYDTLNTNSKKLRDMAVKLVHLFERQPVVNARAAYELITSHHLPVRHNRWSTIVLTRERERVYLRTSSNSMRMLHSVTKELSNVQTLKTNVTLPDQGAYLFLYGGSVDVLSDKNYAKLLKISETFPITDIVVWESSPTSSTFWSIKAGCGQNGNTQLQFAEHVNLKKWKTLCV